MENILIWVSVGLFLLLPYYLCVFLMEKNRNRKHICICICFNALMTFVYYLQLKSLFSPASIILITTTAYYGLSYFFHVKNIENIISQEIIKEIAQTKLFWMAMYVVMTICVVVIIVDIIFLINMKDGIWLDKLYFIGILLVSFVQILRYYRDYKALKEIKIAQ